MERKWTSIIIMLISMTIIITGILTRFSFFYPKKQDRKLIIRERPFGFKDYIYKNQYFLNERDIENNAPKQFKPVDTIILPAKWISIFIKNNSYRKVIYNKDTVFIDDMFLLVNEEAAENSE